VKEIIRMAEIARSNVRKSIDAILTEDEKLIAEVYSNEKAINALEKKITEYLLAVSSTAISSEQSNRVAALFNTVHDAERIGDHAENLVELAQFKIDNKIVFSSTAIEELKEIYGVVDKAIETSLTALENEDKEKVKEVNEYEERVDELRDGLRESHIRRLNNSECNINAGVIFLDIVTNLERISDHSVNIAGIVSPASVIHKTKI